MKEKTFRKKKELLIKKIKKLNEDWASSEGNDFKVGDRFSIDNKEVFIIDVIGCTKDYYPETIYVLCGKENKADEFFLTNEKLLENRREEDKK